MAERRSHQAKQHIKHAQRDQRDGDIIGEHIVEAERADAAALQAARPSSPPVTSLQRNATV